MNVEENVDLFSDHENNDSSFEEHLGTDTETVNLMLNTQDPHSLGENVGNSQSLMHFIKGNIGTGILAMGMLFKCTGLWLGIGLLILCGIIATNAMHILCRVTESIIEKHDLDRNSMDYTESVFNVFKFGPVKLRKWKGKIKHTVNGFLILTQVGFCCVYLLFLTQNIQLFMLSFKPLMSVNIYFVGCIVALILCPLSLITNVRVFAQISIVANFCTFIGIMLIFAYIFMRGFIPWMDLPYKTSFSQILIAFSIAVYSFEGISLVLPIKSKMTTPDFFEAPSGVLNAGMIIVVVLNLAIGFFGYLSFGDDTKSSITYNVQDTELLTMFVKPLFIISIFITYLIQFYIPAAIFSRLMEKLRFHRDGTHFKRLIHLKVMRILLVIFTYAIAMFVPHLDLMLSLLGAFSSSTLAILLPSVLETVHYWPERHIMPRFALTILLKNAFFCVFWLLAFIGGTTVTIMEIIQTF